MPGLVIGGREVQVPGVIVRNFKDDPKLALRVGRPDGNNDGKRRSAPISIIVIHTTKGIPGGKDKRQQLILPGFGKNTDAEDRTASYWSTDPTPSGAHLVFDHDGSVACLADLRDVCAYHAGNSEVNNRSIGIEIFQGSSAEMYEGQLDTVRKVVDVLTAEFGIQRQIPDYYRNRPVPRLDDGGGRDFNGVVGHRDVSDQRGKGDPGDAIMEVLEKSGYERFDLFNSQDIAVWKKRQQTIREKLGREIPIDGVPGPMTTSSLKEMGYQHGLWALPPKAPSGPLHVESLLDVFYPAILASAGSEEAALSAIESWIERKRGA